MKIHLASFECTSEQNDTLFLSKPKYVLGSYHFLKKLSQERLQKYFNYIHSKNCQHFILDSGAFSYIYGNKKNADWITKNYVQYMKEYASFIIKWKCENYIELDLDNVIGYKKVVLLRNELEALTGRQSMPVIHFNTRTNEEILGLIEKYSYLCISGFTGISNNDVGKVARFIKKKGKKLHGLAMTGEKTIRAVPFFSADSSSWTSVTRYGSTKVFDSRTGKGKTVIISKTKKIKVGREAKIKLLTMACNEWKKFVAYSELTN